MKGENYKVYRIAGVLADHGLENKDLAELLNVTPVTVSRWCKHQTQPTEENLYNIARVLKIDLKDLVHSTKWPEGPSEAEVFLKNKRNSKY